MTFRILHVCTGNICRSPMAERLTVHGLRARLGNAADGFDVRSAGTWGHAGAAMEPYALSTLTSLGAEGEGFLARELQAELVSEADLVLGATREHRAAAVVLHPRAASRTFTLREFARLVAAVEPTELAATDPVERARELVRVAAGRRGLVPPAHPRDDDLADPYQGPKHGFAVCGDLVQASLQRPLDLIAG